MAQLTCQHKSIESSDSAILDLLLQVESLSVGELAEAMNVTATAVRQRLNRLSGQGMIERHAERSGRGRPSYRYRLTAKGRRSCGANFEDLAMALWREVRAIEDPEVRRGLLQRLADRLADQYGEKVTGDSVQRRMEEIGELFGERNVPFAVESSDGLPVLTAQACPYPDLAENDRGICAMERMLLKELLRHEVRLKTCRLDGETSCTFEMA
jgi:predicted ArsR family transcriptional regulator